MGGRIKAESTFWLKDHLFNEETVGYLCKLLERAYPTFPREMFRAAVLAAFPALQLKERIAHITATLHACLPPRYPDALTIILDALPPELDPNKNDEDYGDFIVAPLSLFVARYGCTAEYLQLSLDALRQITKRFSAEDATRYFINSFPVETLRFLHECARDENYHVRRLASEGTRPLLPWAQRLTIDYREPLAILDMLFSDRTRYVTRSVANHLNDISKLDAELVIATLRRWRDLGHENTAEMQYITEHALRTLVKRGHAGALELIGFGAAPDITITSLATSTPQVRVGESFRFAVTLRGNSRQKLLIDYIMTFAGDERGPSRKVFKLKQVELEADETLTLEKTHPMRLMTTRRLHSGEHQITLLVNGQPHGSLAFDLIVA